MAPDTPTTPTLSIDGTRLLLDGGHYFLQGLSFFNALFNPPFNKARGTWLDTFLDNGVNTLRVWCQWDFDPSKRPFVDSAPDATLFADDGSVKPDVAERLELLLQETAKRKMVVEVTLFAPEKSPDQPLDYLLTGTRQATGLLKPYRHIILQIWNENSRSDRELFEAAKEVDTARIVTSSTGWANHMGSDEQNRLFDLLTPHTARGSHERFWEEATRQVKELMDTFGKPVLDDEPARCGLIEHGGIKDGTQPENHIAQIEAIRAIGSYHIYHHDMFQRPRENPATPDSGIPDPDYSPFHRRVFDYLKEHRTW